MKACHEGLDHGSIVDESIRAPKPDLKAGDLCRTTDSVGNVPTVQRCEVYEGDVPTAFKEGRRRDDGEVRRNGTRWYDVS